MHVEAEYLITIARLPGMTGGVVVTGASTGIGNACALHLDRIGFRVFAGVRRDEDAERLRSQRLRAAHAPSRST